MKLVFVSSTFRDMQFERDALNTRVVPRINQFLERYSETIHFGDLRWGVNTTELESEESSKKVLKVCLDQIDDCKPYMIIFIGERYGWIPSADLLHGAALLKGMDVSAIKADTSVTELEIEYGALLNPDYEGRILFYFRNPFDMSAMSEKERADYISESPLHREKVEALKEEIRRKYPDYIRYYDVSYDAQSGKLTGLDPLMDQIYEDLKRIFDLDLTYLNSLPAEERGLANSQTQFEKLATDSYARTFAAVNAFDYDGFNTYSEMRFSNTPAFEMVQGRRGAGTKTLVAQKYFNTQKAGANAVCFAYGTDEFTDSVDKMTAAFCWRLEEWMGLPHGEAATPTRFANLCHEYTHRSDLPYLYFFAINLPVEAMLVFHKVAALYPTLFGVGFCVHFRGTLSEEIPLPFFLRNRVLNLPLLSPHEIGEMVNAILKAKRKELPPVVIEEIKRHSAANLPLYLSLLVERLLILDSEDFANIRARGDGMDNINSYMIDLIRRSGDNVTELAKELLEELAERINPTMVPHLVAHLALPSHFNETGIQEFFDHQGWGYSALDYTLFKKTFPSLVYQDVNGFLWYTNREVTAAAAQLATQWGCDGDTAAMRAFLDTKEPKDAIKAQLYLYQYLGDAEAFATAVLTHLDGSRTTNDRTLGTRCLTTFFHVLRKEITQNSDFAFAVSQKFFDGIAQGRVEHPLYLVGYYCQSVPGDATSTEKVERCHDFLCRLEAYLEELRQRGDSEALAVGQCCLRTMHMMPLILRMSGQKRREGAQKQMAYMAREGNAVMRRVVELYNTRQMPIAGLMNSSSGEQFQTFADIWKMDDPLKSPGFKILYQHCENIEKYFFGLSTDYYRLVREGNGPELAPETRFLHAMFLGLWGFCNEKTGQADKARECYETFYSLHSQSFAADPPAPSQRGLYLSVVKLYSQYLLSVDEGQEAKERVAKLFYWGMDQLVETHLDFADAFQMMDLHMLAYGHDCVEGYTHFYTIFGILLAGAATTVVFPNDVYAATDYLSIFSSLLTEEERLCYFVQLTSRLLRGYLRQEQAEAEEVTALLRYLTKEYCTYSHLPLNTTLEALTAQVAAENKELFPEAESAPFFGYGTKHFDSGNRYEGDFVNGRFHGLGVYHFADGGRYEGEFQNDCFHGRGTLIYANGDRYEGEFQNDCFNGYGTLFYINGDRYEGEFQNDQPEGLGEKIFADGDRCKGEWQEGELHGVGIYCFASGDRYEGEFVHDLREGMGRYYWADGEWYEGPYKQDVRHGSGVFHRADGSEEPQVWKRGKRVK